MHSAEARKILLGTSGLASASQVVNATSVRVVLVRNTATGVKQPRVGFTTKITPERILESTARVVKDEARRKPKRRPGVRKRKA